MVLAYIYCILAFGGLLYYGTLSTAFQWKRSDASVSTKALLMSAMLTTEIWATGTRSGREMSKNGSWLHKKTGQNFKPRRTLPGSFFIIPDSLASIHAVVLTFTTYNQTNKQTPWVIYIYNYTSIDARLWWASLLWRAVESALTTVSYRKHF